MLEGGDGGIFAHGLPCLAQQQVEGGVIGDGQGVTVLAVTQVELAFEVHAPQIVRAGALTQRRSLRTVVSAPRNLDQAMTVHHCMDGAIGRRRTLGTIRYGLHEKDLRLGITRRSLEPASARWSSLSYDSAIDSASATKTMAIA